MRNNYIVFISSIVYVLLVLIGCGDDNPVNNSREEESHDVETILTPLGESEGYFEKGICFTSNNEEKTLTFETNKKWNIAIPTNIEWCTVSSNNGVAGTVSLTIKVTENTFYDERNAVLTLKVGEFEKRIRVTQKQQDALLVSSNIFELDKSHHTIDVEVKANVEYKVIIPPTSQKWITQVTKSRSLENIALSFNITSSDEYDKREGEIIFQSKDISEVVHIYQAGEGVLMLTKNEYPVSDKGTVVAVEVNSNFSFDVQMPNVSWVKEMVETRGVSSSTLYYTISPNETYESREAEIIFYDKNSSIKETMKIIQAQKDAIIVSQKEYDIPVNGKVIEIELNANVEYQVTVLDEYDWIKPVDNFQIKGLANNKLYFQIEENTLSKRRKGIITIESVSKAISEDIIINQGRVKDKDAIELHVETAGTLNKLIAPSKKYQITNLILTGNLNGTDIQYLREMAGERSSQGMLQKLDLSEVNIISGSGTYGDGEHAFESVIGVRMFSYCNALVSIILPDNTTSIEQGAFFNAKNLKTIDIPNKVSYIGEGAFYECVSLQSITIPDNVTTILRWTFRDCISLETIVIPASLVSFSMEVSLNNSYSLKQFIVAEDNPVFSTINGVLYNKDKSKLVFYPNASGTSLIIPKEVNSIDDKAFSSCNSLKEIHCLAENPPKCNSYVFSSLGEKCVLYVPKGSYSSYWVANGWGDFLNIIEE